MFIYKKKLCQARIKPGFILNSSDEDDDKIKKPELSVIPVTKTSSGESLRQLPLAASKIAVAQAPKNITDAVLDEDRNVRSFYKVN